MTSIQAQSQGKRILIELALCEPVIPAKAGIHTACFRTIDVQPGDLDSRFRGNDGFKKPPEFGMRLPWAQLPLASNLR